MNSSSFPFFILNCPIYVPDTIYTSNQSHTYIEEVKNPGTILISENKPSTDINEISVQIENKVQSILDNLERKGFISTHKHLLKTNVKVVFGFNRPRLLNEELNSFLYNFLALPSNSDIDHQKFGFFWNNEWREGKRTKLSYDQVKRTYETSNQVNKALLLNKQKSAQVPMCTIREYIKNHTHTRNYYKKIRESNPNSSIYLVLIDDDVCDFNEILSSYISIHNSEKKPPRVMSTGYQIEAGDNLNPERLNLLKKKSFLDRIVRIATAELIPKYVYYPEPNMCVRIDDEKEIQAFSFLSKKLDFNMESPNLLRKLEGKFDGKFVFSEKPPILLKASGKMASSSNLDFETGDQTHLNPRTWALSLYHNRKLIPLKDLNEDETNSDNEEEQKEPSRHYTRMEPFRKIFAYFSGYNQYNKYKRKIEENKGKSSLKELRTAISYYLKINEEEEVALQMKEAEIYWSKFDVHLILRAAKYTQFLIFAYFLANDDGYFIDNFDDEYTVTKNYIKKNFPRCCNRILEYPRFSEFLTAFADNLEEDDDSDDEEGSNKNIEALFNEWRMTNLSAEEFALYIERTLGESGSRAATDQIAATIEFEQEEEEKEREKEEYEYESESIT